MDVILGIDTSCYTTSAAVADIHTQKCVNFEIITLIPEKGEKGLRQSTALFFHIKNLPVILHKLLESNDYTIKGVCVSSRPRPVEGSYMPVFEAGVCVAKSIASALGVSCYQTTHQENHIMAASNDMIGNEFYAAHLSGGTTELLLAKSSERGFDIDIVSATQDISFGKLVDRVGVKLGYEFPAGKALENAAMQGNPVFAPNIKLYSGNISLSGAEKQFLDACDLYPAADVAASLFNYIGALLAKWIAFNVKCESDVLLAGGVASNMIVREIMTNSPELKNIKLHFAQPDLCRDNAVGTSLIGVKIYESEHK